MRRILMAGVSTLVLLSFSFAQADRETMGSIRGQVVTRNQDGETAVLPDARVVLHGPTNKEAQSDASGAFAIDGLPPGQYEIEASAPGLKANVEVEVEAGSGAVVPIELSVATVADTVTVAANDTPAIDESAQKTTINQSVVEHAPNADEKIDSLLPLVPGVVRGPDGRINMKGAQATQAGWLVNSANVTDPATGGQAINLPIDVVSSVQVISNPYDPEYGKFTGAISSVETKTSNAEKYHLSAQNFVPRARDRDGHIVGIGAFTPRLTFTGPIVKDRLAFTQSFEYRFVQTPVESLPPLQRDSKLESFDSFSQFDLKINDRQTANLSVAVFPQKLDFLGLNTFVPQPSTPDLHQRGYQISGQHHYVSESGDLLTSQIAYESFDANIFGNSLSPYRLLVDTTQGGFFNRQNRDTDRVEWQEILQIRPKQFFGEHQFKVGLDFSHSDYEGGEQFLPVNIVGVSDSTLQSIEFSAPTTFSVRQNELAWFGGDQYTPWSRLRLDFGLRFDRDSITDSTHAAPRAALTLALTSDRKTLLKAGGGLFYDRVPLNAAAFTEFPDRTLVNFDPTGQLISTAAYSNAILGGLKNPRSGAWNVELDRQVTERLLVRVAYQQRNTVYDLIVNPVAKANGNILSLASGGRDFYHEFQVTGRYQLRHHTINASYVRSRATGDLNDFNQFFGNIPQPVIQANARGRLPFDAPNRFLMWGELRAPWRVIVMPVFDLHTGFPYSLVNQYRDFVGPRNDQQFRRFESLDIQAMKEITVPFRGKERKFKVGLGVYNLFNYFNPRDVQNDVDSSRFGDFFNGPNRTYRGKFVFGF